MTLQLERYRRPGVMALAVLGTCLAMHSTPALAQGCSSGGGGGMRGGGSMSGGMGGNGSGVTGGGSLGIDLGTSMAFMQASQQAQQAQALQRMRMVQFQLALQQQQLAQQQAQFERLKQLRRAARATSTIREHRRIRGDRATTVADSTAQTRTILVLSPRDKG